MYWLGKEYLQLIIRDMLNSFDNISEIETYIQSKASTLTIESSFFDYSWERENEPRIEEKCVKVTQLIRKPWKSI